MLKTISLYCCLIIVCSADPIPIENAVETSQDEFSEYVAKTLIEVRDGVKTLRQDVADIKIAVANIGRPPLPPLPPLLTTRPPRPPSPRPPYPGPASPSPLTQCPVNAEFLMNPRVNKCYQIVRRNANWTEAARQCSLMDSRAHLAFVESTHEQDFFNTIPADMLQHFGCHVGHYGPELWVGGQRRNPQSSSSEFVWKAPGLTDKPMTTYTNWHIGQPDDYQYPNQPELQGNVEACINMISGWGWEWNDSLCLRPMCALCEIALSP